MTDFTLSLMGAQVSDNGEMTRLKAKTPSGEEVTLTFPSEELEMLMIALSRAAGQSARIRHANPAEKHVLPCEWWEVNPHPSLQGLLLSFRIPGGLEVTFHLDKDASFRFEEVVATLLGLRTPPIPQGSKN